MIYCDYYRILESFSPLSVVSFQELLVEVEWVFIYEALVKISLVERHVQIVLYKACAFMQLSLLLKWANCSLI
jgi:hypothetical protein